MTYENLTILGPHWAALQGMLLDGSNGSERCGYVLLGKSTITDPWTGRSTTRLVSHDVVSVPASDVLSAGPDHITWSTDSLVHLLKRARDEDLVPAIVHTHLEGPANFSEQDDANEPNLVRLARNRNGENVVLASILLSHSGDIGARVWVDPDRHVPIDRITILGDRLRRYGVRGDEDDPALHRQALAFGSAFNGMLKSLQVGVVGCGGTGSAVLTLLARLGVPRIVAFDKDPVELTNLHRLHGATREDAEALRLKVHVAKREAERIGMGVGVHAVPHWADDPCCRDALKSCDILFGCTDDDSGRLFLNRVAHFYGIPLIDVGLAIKVSDADPPIMQDLSARVSLIQPGVACLACRGIASPRRAADQDLRRRIPDEFAVRKAEAYVLDGGDPNPAVVTFTTSAAAMAVDEMIDLLVGYRRRLGPRPVEWRRRFHLMRDAAQEAEPAGGCMICDSPSYWGRGDIDPFLDRVG